MNQNYQQHKCNMELARNPLAVPECLLKQNFATSPKRNFDDVNCSEDQTSVVYKTSVRPQVQQERGEEEE
jgi:hypothetical protein